MLSPAARRAIAIRSSIARKAAAANDAAPAAPRARRTRAPRPLTVACNDACVEAAGFAEHAALPVAA